MSPEYPRFISNKPCGKDKFDGKSQERLSEAIAKHIEKNDTTEGEKCALARIIGVDGSWGSGKSNVIKLLEDRLGSEYHFFCYDAWGNQEDLQRRSILELLTSNLMANEILDGYTVIRTKGGGEEPATWSEKLKLFLARKTEKTSEKYPRISDGTFAALLVTVTTPFFTLLASFLKSDTGSLWNWALSLLVAMFPFIVALVVWLLAIKKDARYKDPAYLFAIFQDKIENNVCYETLSVEEPTVPEFKQWMTDISEHIKDNNKKRLVIVFDNMDRLPAEKVKQLWSSIHTFFAEDGFKHIWAVIPFDEQHLSCAFGTDDQPQTKELTRYFINKTFPIVFRVSPPVITDYKGIIDAYMLEAFGDISAKEFSEVNRYYRTARANPNVREVIVFINELVALKDIWENQLTLVALAIYTLNRCDLENSKASKVEDLILSGEYLGSLRQHIENTEELQSSISALAYGVDVEIAAQIPLKRYLENCIKGEEGHDINKFKDSNSKFDLILDDVVRDSDTSTLNKIISELYRLDKESDIITSLWELFAEKLLEVPLNEQKLSDTYKFVLLKTKGMDIQQLVLRYFVSQIQYFEDFKGDRYYTTMASLDAFLYENQLACTYELDEICLTPDEVEEEISYVQTAKDDLEKYKLHIDSEGIDKYLAAKIEEDLFRLDVLTVLTKKGYQFNSLERAIEEKIKSDSVINTRIVEIYQVYKVIHSKGLLERIPKNSVSKMLGEFRPHVNIGMQSEYCLLAAMAISYEINEAYISDEVTEEIASHVQCFTYYGSLLIQSVTYQYDLWKRVARYLMTEYSGTRIMTIKEVLPRFNEIASCLGVDKADVLKDLNKWSQYAKDISPDEIETIIKDKVFWQLLLDEVCDLSKYLISIANKRIPALEVDYLYQVRNQTNYWRDLITLFLQRDAISELPENLVTYGRRIMTDFLEKGQGVPTLEIDKQILIKLDYTKAKDILLKLANKIVTGQFQIDRKNFLFLEKRMRDTKIFAEAQGGNAGAVTHFIAPVFDDVECWNLILDNKEYYVEIINESGDIAYGVKQQLKSKLEQNQDELIVSFASLVGVEIPSE